MTDTQRPADYLRGASELVIATRQYVGLSTEAFAERMNIALRSLQRIENGQRPMPPGFIDTMDDVVADFEAGVGALVDEAEQRGTQMLIELSGAEWTDSMIRRAAVETAGAIIPIKVGDTVVTETREAG